MGQYIGVGEVGLASGVSSAERSAVSGIRWPGSVSVRSVALVLVGSLGPFGARGSGWLVLVHAVGHRCRSGGGCPASLVPLWSAAADWCFGGIGEAKALEPRWPFALRLLLRCSGVPSGAAIKLVSRDGARNFI